MLCLFMPFFLLVRISIVTMATIAMVTMLILIHTAVTIETPPKPKLLNPATTTVTPNVIVIYILPHLL